ncbi:hypothetical protein PIROE2DRAFT_3908 [Piromyces sp. E2]|nr:hypothetical protein PIROE2DRAFT_3908 [Piromyces sp. E2]|eukprot:OUM68448.1 hypothetical protein PIROE2DRAFT_3908 [Piromyces sp. E2]
MDGLDGNGSSSSFFNMSDKDRLHMYVTDKNMKENPVYVTPLSINENRNIDKFIKKQDETSTAYFINEKNGNEDDTISSEIIISSNNMEDCTKIYNNDNMDETNLTLNNEHFEQFKNESQFFENYVFTQTQQSTSLNNNNSLIDKNNSLDIMPFKYDNNQLSLNKEKKYVDNNFESINQKLKNYKEKINIGNEINNDNSNIGITEQKIPSNNDKMNISNKDITGQEILSDNNITNIPNKDIIEQENQLNIKYNMNISNNFINKQGIKSNVGNTIALANDIKYTNIIIKN